MDERKKSRDEEQLARVRAQEQDKQTKESEQKPATPERYRGLKRSGREP